MPIRALTMGFWGENWGRQILFVVLSLYECSISGLMPYKSNSIKIGHVVLVPGVRKISDHRKRKLKTMRYWYFIHVPRCPHWGDHFEFGGMRWWLSHQRQIFCWLVEGELPSVLWRCWLGGRKGIRSVKNWVVVCWRGYLERGADLHMAQLMPRPLTVSCFSKIQIGLPFWYRLTRVVLEKEPLNGVCVCVAEGESYLEQVIAIDPISRQFQITHISFKNPSACS